MDLEGNLSVEGWQSILARHRKDPSNIAYKILKTMFDKTIWLNTYRESLARYALYLQWKRAIGEARTKLGENALGCGRAAHGWRVRSIEP